jgi:chemotaxis protein methyltransferase CheR
VVTTTLDEREMERVRRRLYDATGIALSPFKQQMVTARLARRVKVLQLPSISSYLDLLDRPQGREEVQGFINALTTNKTSFFREEAHFDQLAEQLSALAGAGQTSAVRIWCAASSTGEEPWTLAMVAHRCLAERGVAVRILATDIDTDVLDRARRAVYPAECLGGIPARFHDMFIPGKGAHVGEVRVRRVLRESVVFRQLNLRREFPLRGPFDAIFCRNALIYFKMDDQIDTVQRMSTLLSPEGRLYLGHSEGLVGVRAGLQPFGHCIFGFDAQEEAARAG